MSELKDRLRNRKLNEDDFPLRLRFEAADRIEELENPWISVDKRLPVISDIDGLGFIIVLATDGLWVGETEYTHFGFVTPMVTHWMPLPPPPTGDK